MSVFYLNFLFLVFLAAIVGCGVCIDLQLIATAISLFVSSVILCCVCIRISASIHKP